MRDLRACLLLLALWLGWAVEARAGELSITVTGTPSAEGQLLIAVFDHADRWLSRPVARASVRPGEVARIPLAPGTYAVAAVHDANGNGRMDRTALGLPREAFGFSRGARAQFGPPAFADAAFEMRGAPAALTIRLRVRTH